MRTLRNVAIIMVLALAVAFAPAGGNAADAVLTALTMGFLAGIAWMLYVMSRQNQLTLATLSDARRAILYGAFGTDRAAGRRHRQAVLDRRRHSGLDPDVRRLGGRDLAHLDRGQHLLSAGRAGQSARPRD